MFWIQISDPNEEEKEEESKSLESLDSDDSMIDEDRPIEKPGVMNTGNTRWKCPVCEKICLCNKCRKDKGLPPLSSMADIHKAIKNKFPNVWTYLIYNRDNPNGNTNATENDEEDDDESGETTNNNNNNNNSNRNNNNDVMDEEEEVFQKPKRKAAAAKTEKKVVSPKEKKPKKAKKNIIEEEEFIVEDILDKRKRKVRSDPNSIQRPKLLLTKSLGCRGVLDQVGRLRRGKQHLGGRIESELSCAVEKIRRAR